MATYQSFSPCKICARFLEPIYDSLPAILFGNSGDVRVFLVSIYVTNVSADIDLCLVQLYILDYFYHEEYMTST